MPITALPQDTARAITATLVLNDATSVVKELIDNALDAKASSVTVEASPNTLDVIQVKDNGFGIGVEDRQLLCKQGCTSKIRNLEDLASLGGTFLGFRGEALASVAELSTSVTLTTRVEGEVVGTALKFGPDGKLQSSSSASRPVGTTVRIQGFLTNIPVRRQTALKSVSKTLVSIRKLLQAYALARPEVRVSFKVLKAKDGKSDWSYAPTSAGAGLLEAVSRVAGKEVAAQCTQHDVDDCENGAVAGPASYKIRAVLVVPTADVIKACNAEQYCSVDGRPVASDKGFIKGLVKTYKDHLRSALNAAGFEAKLPRPLLYMHISCPSNSYDVNVEPAKDEVLFYHPTKIGDLFTQMLVAFYGEAQANQREESTKPPLKPAARQTGAFDILLARKPMSELPTRAQDNDESLVKTTDVTLSTTSSRSPASPPTTSPVSNAARTSSPLRNVTSNNATTNINMFTVDDDEQVSGTDKIAAATDEDDLDWSDGQDEPISNPWTMAKMNTRTAAHITAPATLVAPEAGLQPSVDSRPQRPQSSPHRTRLGQTSQLPSPAHSSHDDLPYQNPGPPLRRRVPRAEDDGADLSATDTSELGELDRPSSLLDTWIQKQHSSQVLPGSSIPTTQSEEVVHAHHQAPSRPRQTTLRSGQCSHDRQRRPFKSSLKRPRLSQSSTSSSALYEEQGQIGGHTAQVGTPSSLTTSRVNLQPSSSQQLQSSSNRQELDEILEFERQKRLAIARQRKQAIQSTIERPLPTPSPSQMGAARPQESLAPEMVGGRSQLDTSATPCKEDFEERFGQQDLQVEHPRHHPRNNPHYNRFLAATRKLDTTQIADRAGYNDLARHPPQVVQEDSLKMPDSDPRAYLISEKEQGKLQDTNGANGLTRTGAKLKRTKTNRLPLEIVPVEFATHDLAIDFEMDLATVRSEMMILLPLDEYVKPGMIDSQQQMPSPLHIDRWQVSLQNIMKKNFRSRGETNGEADRGHPGLDFDVDLEMAFKAHLDAMSTS